MKYIRAALKAFDELMYKHRWTTTIIAYIILCVYTFFSNSTSIDGIELTRTQSGLVGLALIHGIVVVAFIGAILINAVIRMIFYLNNNFK